MRLREVRTPRKFRPREDFLGNPQKSDRAGEIFRAEAEIGENSWNFSFSDPISLLIAVKYSASYEQTFTVAIFNLKLQVLYRFTACCIINMFAEFWRIATAK